MDCYWSNTERKYGVLIIHPGLYCVYYNLKTKKKLGDFISYFGISSFTISIKPGVQKQSPYRFPNPVHSVHFMLQYHLDPDLQCGRWIQHII